MRRIVVHNHITAFDFAHPMTVSREAEERFRNEAYLRHGITRANDDRNERVTTLLTEARKLDFMDFLPGLTKIKLIPDIDQWNAAYLPSLDTVELEAKFFSKPPAEQLQIFMHEIGHRGQIVKPVVYKEFLAEGLGSEENFLAMANAVHQEDYKANGIDNPGEEAFAESYSRYVLNRPLPVLIRNFWQEA